MNKFFILIILGLVVCTAKAKTTDTTAKHVQLYGQIDTADLRLKVCDFEKDANAMVLFDYGSIKVDSYGDITYIRHKRIKIFNDNAKDEANITINYVDGIKDIEAETINLNGKAIEYIPVDSKLIYKQKTDKYYKSVVFTFPAVKSGSVIEFQYKWHISSDVLPSWYFQTNIPTAYSEINLNIDIHNFIKPVYKVSQDFSKKVDDNTSTRDELKTIRALSNVHSFKEEPFMTPAEDNIQRVEFKPLISFWERVVNKLIGYEEFGAQLHRSLTGEDAAINSISKIKDKNVIIDSVFNTVKNRMVWNKQDAWYTIDGIQKAWDKKTGNSAEINLILYQLLTKAGINAFPMLVSTPDNGPVDPDDARLSQFNKTVVLIAPDTLHNYILDATGKYNLYNQVPTELLSTYGLAIDPRTVKLGSYGMPIDPKTVKWSILHIKSDTTAKQLVYINAEIKANGKMSGTADIISDSYNREKSLKAYDDLSEKKYIDLLADNDNAIKITGLKLGNIKTDTLPLAQHFDFELNLTASDENYIYFNPNLFTTLGANPFLSEHRYSDIDFHYKNTYTISGIYKIPPGYKIDVLPKNQIIVAEDKSLTFKRLIGEQNGNVAVRYIITFKKTYYYKEEYSGLFQFYKKMYDMLNEQIVLKKS